MTTAPGGADNGVLAQVSRVRKPIASLCHGPWVLASARCLQGRVLTSWPGVRDDMVNAEATWLDQEVVRDDNLVTSRGPQDLVPFLRAITELFSGSETMQQDSERQIASSPQRNAPPQLALSTRKWLPRPSFRITVGIGALMLGLRY